MLKSIAIKNYRSCLNTSLDLHPKLSVLIGPNGSGKTNILQAIMLLNKLALDEGRFRRSPDTAGVSSVIKAVFRQDTVLASLRASINTHADDSNSDVIEESKQNWRFKSADGKSESLRMPIAFASSYRGYSLRTHSMRFHQSRLSRSQLSLFPLDPITEKNDWAFRVLGKVSDFCAGIKYYGASQFTNPSSCPVSFEIEGDGRASGPVRLAGHARLLYNIYSASKANPPDRYQQFLDIIGPNGLRLITGLTFREVPTSSIDHSVKVGGKVEKRPRKKLLVVPQFRIGRQRLSPNQLSEGTFKTLALLFHVIISNSTAILIEEPEVCVHHGLLSSILELIKSYSGQKQMILSTHSDYVLDQVAPENVFKVTLDKADGTVARYIPKTMSARELHALRLYLDTEGNLGEFWREGGLGDRS
jgi:ABC-type lipoprotein export system ATPase subunit